jgi:hypothetical protein
MLSYLYSVEKSIFQKSFDEYIFFGYMVTAQVDRLYAEGCYEKAVILRILKVCLVQESTVTPAKRRNHALLSTSVFNLNTCVVTINYANIFYHEDKEKNASCSSW